MGRKMKLGLPVYGAPIKSRMGIYAIVNISNGKQYVGQTIDFHRRRKKHLYELENGKHGNAHLQNAFELYGKNNFAFTILEYVFDKQELNERELAWIEHLKPEYNIWDNPYEQAAYYLEKSGGADGQDCRPKWHAWVYGHGRNPLCRK